MMESGHAAAARALSAYDLRTATEAAARAARGWLGQGNKAQLDAAAIEAMAAQLQALPVSGRVVIGEGPIEETSQLYHGQTFGEAEADGAWDIAADPIEGTSFLAKGMTNAMACVAMSPHGTMFDPGPAFYMEKFAAPPAARGRIDPEAPVEDKLRTLAHLLGKPVTELSVFVLEKPRHRDLVTRIQALGARVRLYPAGDVGGALMAAIGNSGVDALMGTGGCVEGVLSACAIRVMGGEFMARLDPQLATERRMVLDAGLDTQHWRGVEDLVRSDDVLFCATGITTGLLLEGVERNDGCDRTQTLMVGGRAAGIRQILTTLHPRER